MLRASGSFRPRRSPRRGPVPRIPRADGGPGGQPRPAPGASAFHGAGRHLKDAGCLRDGVALHVDEDEGRPLLGGQRGQGFLELAVEVLPHGGGLGRFMGFQELIEPFGVVHGGRLAGGGLADPVEAGVDGDPVQPGGDRRLAAKGVGGAEGVDEGVLDGVGRFLPVPQRAHRHGPEPVAVAAYEFAEGVGVARHVLGEQVRVARCLWWNRIHRAPPPNRIRCHTWAAPGEAVRRGEACRHGCDGRNPCRRKRSVVRAVGPTVTVGWDR